MKTPGALCLPPDPHPAPSTTALPCIPCAPTPRTCSSIARVPAPRRSRHKRRLRIPEPTTITHARAHPHRNRSPVFLAPRMYYHLGYRPLIIPYPTLRFLCLLSYNHSLSLYLSLPLLPFCRDITSMSTFYLLVSSQFCYLLYLLSAYLQMRIANVDFL
jgi:hypothetical protein